MQGRYRKPHWWTSGPGSQPAPRSSRHWISSGKQLNTLINPFAPSQMNILDLARLKPRPFFVFALRLMSKCWSSTSRHLWKLLNRHVSMKIGLVKLLTNFHYRIMRFSNFCIRTQVIQKLARSINVIRKRNGRGIWTLSLIAKCEKKMLDTWNAMHLYFNIMQDDA